ncbi:hypothetical protein [Dysgonomonas sp. GY617]|uniref:hypothetical protein n=1 Tax=Dysgonomonas sp. GY617 TaxID=2780420 RepID=UPI00188335AF|nr:hypothetical protein [Dysgonomonas sp. GY617]MBF0576311.1 hypothetical protein [Dysgonomonas sp. GY617]
MIIDFISIKKGILLTGIFSISTFAFAQIGINTATPHSTLDIEGSIEANRVAGIQAPRLTLAALTAKISSLYGANQIGALIYITNVSGGDRTGQRVNISSPGYYYFDGSFWQNLGIPEPKVLPGDIKYSVVETDHDGWYLMNGRTVASLPANLRPIAQKLGFTNNLPDTRDRFLKTKTGTEAVGVIGGTNTFTIAEANLPNLNLSGSFSGISASGGASHAHTFSGTSASGGSAHNHTFSGTSASGGAAHTHTLSSIASGNGGAAHTHPFSGTSSNTGNHTHTYLAPPRATTKDRGPLVSKVSVDVPTNNQIDAAGAHTHTFSATSSNNAHTHTYSGNAASTSHTHAYDGTSTSTAHNHTFSTTSESSGAHNHTLSGNANFSLGGSGTALSNRSAYLVVNAYVYLGQ